MKKQLLLSIALIGGAMFNTLFAQYDLPEGMVALTPDGVTVNINEKRAYDKDKALTVAGNKEKGYKIYFAADDGVHGEELWVSDGTLEGTKMVKDIYPGPTSSDVRYLTRFNDKVVFQAVGNDEAGAELWISDGTEEGTYMLKNINILGGSNPMGFTQLNETHFIFGAIDVESYLYADEPQHWLWISDGTEEGTQLLKECKVIYPGTSNDNDNERQFVRVGRKVFFKGDSIDEEYGEELWVTDGTADGTFLVKDINKTPLAGTNGTGGSRIDWMTNFKNEKLFFAAYSDEYGFEPWVSDGTPDGTYMIADLTEGEEANGNPRGHGTFTPRVYKDEVYFRGYHPTYGLELFKTDFTEEGTYMVADLNQNPTADGSGTENGSPDLFVEYQGVLFMKAQSGSNPNLPNNYGLELFYSDGTEAGTVMQSDLNPGTGPNAAWEGTVVSGSFYMRAQDETPAGSQFWELFKIDNKDEFPVKVVDLGEGQDYVHSLRNMNGDLYFTSVISPRLYMYHYRKPDFDPLVDVEEMNPDFGDGPWDNSSTSIAKNEIEKATVSFYPNPARDRITIESATAVKGYSITDMSGRRVADRKGSETVISISDLGVTPGAYILGIATEEGETHSLLIVE